MYAKIIWLVKRTLCTKGLFIKREKNLRNFNYVVRDEEDTNDPGDVSPDVKNEGETEEENIAECDSANNPENTHEDGSSDDGEMLSDGEDDILPDEDDDISEDDYISNEEDTI